ncbi:MAG: hypothetical protein H7A33_00010 [Deltaproteobacteria bacterium]|nr:hypothetical protein [Deltaproteobacteria bacterium]
MKNVKSIRFTDELCKAMEFVAENEKIEESQSLRKLASIGFETYIAELYSRGKLSLREAAKLLKKDMNDTLVLMAERGVTGNIGATEVMESLESLS